jgi:hypothetical protein
MKRIAVVLSTLALLSVGACGGSSHSCQDAVNAINTCAATLGSSSPITLEECNGSSCSDKDKALDCIVGLQCPSTASGADAYATAVENCAVQGGCN